MQEFLEAAMVLSFGISWPMSILKSYRAKTAKGKSLFFLLMILFGYACGIIWKCLEYMDTGKIAYPSYFYVLNFIMVSIDIVLYFHNNKLDKQAEAKAAGNSEIAE